jgi:para-nitrobenzyl esterase
MSGSPGLFKLRLFLLSLLPLPPVMAEEPPRVVANGEELAGLWEGEEGCVAAFRGVPFAAPPVGDRRWRAPQPHEPRGGLQAATAFAPACMQSDYLVEWYQGVAVKMGHSPDVVGRPNGVSEDCLYLNVWTPDPDPREPMPVMVWVHGGSNKSGWSYEPNYIGNRLAARGVVVVTIAYRVGPFGFFSHPALDNGPGEPVANFGLLDMAEAFRWVRRNISAFGGDPENVTAVGESSGAGDIRDWLAAEIVEDPLYHKSIAQSPAGGLTDRKTLSDEQAAGRRLVAHLGLDNRSVSAAGLRAIPARDIIEAAAEALEGHGYDAVIDGLTMKEMPLESFDREQMSRVKLMIGTNRDEWYMYLDPGAGQGEIDGWLDRNAPRYATVLRSKVAGEQDARRALDRLITAKRMNCPARHVAAHVNALGGEAWVYYFTRQRPGAEMKGLGAYHGTEIGYVFDQHEVWQPVDEVDKKLTRTVMDYWVQFARTGNPNLPGRPHWPRYTAADPRLLELGVEVRAIPAPDADLCLWLGPPRE